MATILQFRSGGNDMKRLIPALFVTFALAATGLFVTPAAAKVPPNATTVTNVCMVYQYGGELSGGVPVIAPQAASYRYISDTGWAFLWLPDGSRLRVEFLGISLLQPGDVCAGIV